MQILPQDGTDYYIVRDLARGVNSRLHSKADSQGHGAKSLKSTRYRRFEFIKHVLFYAITCFQMPNKQPKLVPLLQLGGSRCKDEHLKTQEDHLLLRRPRSRIISCSKYSPSLLNINIILTRSSSSYIMRKKIQQRTWDLEDQDSGKCGICNIEHNIVADFGRAGRFSQWGVNFIMMTVEVRRANGNHYEVSDRQNAPTKCYHRSKPLARAVTCIFT